MSNIFNKELEQALTKVNNRLYESGLVQHNTEQAAKLSLYYAHGQTEQASNKLKEEQKKASAAGVQYHTAYNASEICTNIVTAATAAATDANNTAASVSTAAANIQGAANAVSRLAGDVSIMLALSTAKDYGSKLQDLVKKAAKEAQKAADEAEETTINSLNTTIEAAQTRANGTLAQAKTVQGDVGNLVKTLDSDFDTLQGLVNTDLNALATAIQTEKEKSGVYETALAEYEAIQTAEVFINEHVNNNLLFAVAGNDTTGGLFSLSFDAFPDQSNIKEYRMIITTADDAPTFDIRSAKAVNKKYYTRVIPRTNAKSYTRNFMTPEYIANNPDKTQTPWVAALDFKGDPVERGTPFVFFVYVVYTAEYQSESNDTAGYLSLPSADFTLLCQLPVPLPVSPDGANRVKLTFYQSETGDDAVRVYFKMHDSQLKAPNGTDLTLLSDFRVFLFNESDYCSNIINNETRAALNLLADLDEDMRLAQEAAADAESDYNTAVATGQPADVIEEKYRKMEWTKTDYINKRAKYMMQLRKVQNLNDEKISDFFVDNDILNSISAANGMIAKENNYLPFELEERVAQYVALAAALTGDVDGAKSRQTELNKILAKAQKTIAKAFDNINNLNQQADKIKAEIGQHQADRLKKNEEEKDINPVDKEDVKRIVQIQEQEEIDVFMIYEDNQDLKNISKQIKDHMDVIEAEEKIVRETNQLLTDANSDFEIFDQKLKNAKANVENLKKEIEDLDLGSDKGEDGSAEEESAKGSAKAKKKGGKKSPSKDGWRAFEAKNESGDFVDNYGQPLVHGSRYAALVFTVIKDTEPEAAPLFDPHASEFSDLELFDLVQL
ncbi:MAG: hypothetical protein AAFZ15_23500 [Bacteroidota bacterium]